MRQERELVILMEAVARQEMEPSVEMQKAVQGIPVVRKILAVHKGLQAEIRNTFPGTTWQRCKVHFMRNILAYVP